MINRFLINTELKARRFFEDLKEERGATQMVEVIVLVVIVVAVAVVFRDKLKEVTDTAMGKLETMINGTN